MSWELEVGVALSAVEDQARLARAVAGALGDALCTLTYREWGERWDYGKKPLLEQKLDPQNWTDAAMHDQLCGLSDSDRVGDLKFGLRIQDTELHIRPVHLLFFGAKHPGNSPWGPSFSALIDFENRQRYRGNDSLITGERVDERFVLRVLTHVCDVAMPPSLYVVPEQNVCIPINYHLAFHSSFDGFIDDLREIARLVLRGGGGYGDARDRYEPLLDMPVHSIMFCGRSRGWAEGLLGDLRGHRPVLEALLSGLEVPEWVIDEAMFKTRGIEPMNTARGVGVMAEPFLRSYLDPFYTVVLDLLATEMQSGRLDGRADRDSVTRLLMSDFEETDDGALVPVDRRSEGVPNLCGEGDSSLHRFEQLVQRLSSEVLEGIGHFLVIVGPAAELPPNVRCTDEGELWEIVDAEAQPMVVRPVQCAGKPIVVRRSGPADVD